MRINARAVSGKPVKLPTPWELLRPVEWQALEITRPPSTNACFKNIPGRGRARTSEYNAWIAHATQELALQKPGCVRGKFSITLQCQRDSEWADIDNIVKPTLDALKKFGCIVDDRFCAMLSAEWMAVTGDRLDVMIVHHPKGS